jgi:predicted dehydrogenase
LKVGIVGGGFIGKQHIEAIRRMPHTFVASLCEQDMESARAIALQMGIPGVYSNIDDMLPSINILHNCAPSHLHYDITKRALQAGISVLCEKPFTLTSAQSAELVQLARDKNLPCAVMFNYRHNIMVEEMRARVAEGSVGKPWFISAEYLQDWLLYDTDYNWRVAAQYGGHTRALSDIGSHCFDTLQYILDDKISAVLCTRQTLHPTRVGAEGRVPVENEDAAIIHLRFTRGTNAIVRVSQVSAGRKNDFRIFLEGTTASLEWHQEKPDRLTIGNRDSGNVELYADAKYLTGAAKAKATLPNGHAVGWADAFAAAMKNFYAAVRGKAHTPDFATFETAHHNMQIIDACVSSDTLGTWVNI